MKRASTKVSMPKFEDGTQKKISSFFQKGSAPAQSKLFTSVRKARPSPLLQQQLKASSNSCPETVSACSNDISSHGIIPKAAWRDNYNVQSQDVTSVCKTPEKPESRLEVVVGESPDVVVIPDTPEEKLEKPRLKKISRSFLCPVDLLTTRPCRKPSLSKVKVKHKTKSSLGPVTIEFGQKRQGDDQGNDFSKKTGTQFANNVNSTDMWLGSELLDLDDDAGPASFACKPMSSLPEQTQPYFRQAELNSAAEDSRLSVMHAKLSTNGRSVKRMSQPGLSPAAKKTLFTEVMLKDNIDKCFNTNHKVKAKRQLAVMNGFKDVKEMNQSVNGYQMGIDASVRQNSVSCAEDDVLADILGQMISIPTEQQGQPEKVPNSITFTSVSQPERKFLKESLDCHAADDEVLTDILGELKDFVNQGHSLGSEISTASKTSDLPVKKLIPVSYNDNLVRKPTLSHTRLLVDKGIKISEIVKPNSQKRNLSDKSLAEHLVYTHTVDEKDHLSSAHLCHGEETSRAGKMPATKMQLDLTADMEETLSESFEHMSPFKTSTLRESVQSPAESQTTSQLKFVNRWNRFVVQGVNHDRQSHTIALELSEEGGTRVNRYAVLQGSWSDILVETGDIVHLVFDGKQASDDIKLENSNNCPVVIDDEQGLIAVNPDILLSGTSIVSGIHCLRRSVLNEKFKGVDSKNVHMLYGSIIHSLFQEVLKNRLTKTEEILTTAMSVIQSNKFLHDMYGQSVTETQVTDEIQAYIEPLQAWLKKYVPSTTETRNSRCSDLSIVQIHDIEETIWSPRLGVKGKIDMTVEVEIQENGQLRKKILPLELKTGKASYSAEHKGQVTLYSMMMADRHENVDEGLLLYLKHNDMNSVPVKPENKRGLVQLRNEMAYYLRRHAEKTRDDKNDVIYKLGQLPHPINSFQSCSKCPQLINCAIYQRSVEDMKHISGHAMNDLVPDSLSHLSESHLKYFTHWILCMDLEMAHQHTEGLSNIWRKSSSEREQCGDCLQQLMIVDSVLGVPETQAFTEGKGCCVQFQRKPGFEGGLLNGVGLTKNDSVVISSEDGKYIALSTGFIKHMTESVVDVVVDRDSFHENIAFQSLVFRIDRCDVFNTSGYLLTNLYRLMEPSQHRQKLRSLIIDHKKPEFQLKMAKSAVEKVKQIFKPLNKPQKTAILKVLMAKDFVLIKGYPGTGKTSTIVALVKILKELGQSVLLTSYTHSAVDNILLKLKKDGVPFLRLGRSSRIHPLIQDHASETLTLDCRSVDELRDLYNSYNIIATSCLGSNHPVFTQRRFDVCIVDEASQVLQPACLGPLFSSSRFVLVGDPQQLPPIVQSREASLLGMEESLFVRLDGAGATYDLTLQYRMNSTIMQLSNELVYQGALQCGDDKVSQACIQHSQSFPSGQPEWLMRALDTSLTNAVVFLDTCQMVAPESCEGRGLTNDVEADLIWRLAVAFRQAGISATEIGVITPYRAQVKALQRRLSECLSVKDIEVNTVDQYQGRDKSVVLISFVRSAAAIDPIMKGNLLQDIRRLNVALTRAKNKLVLVGNSSTLSNYCPIGNLLKILQSKQHIFVLPAELSI